MKSSLFLILFVLAGPVLVFSQACNRNIPANEVWAARTLTTGSWKAGGAEDIQLSAGDQGKITISDLFAGFFKTNYIPYEMQAQIELNCEASVVPFTFESDFGAGSVTSGEWDAENKTLTIKWSIPSNKLDETSIFQIR